MTNEKDLEAAQPETASHPARAASEDSAKDALSKMHGNRYDWLDIVQRPYLMRADHATLPVGIKFAAYKVRDPDTGKVGPYQFHATYDNTVLAVMGESAALLFCQAVLQTLGYEPPKKIEAGASGAEGDQATS